MDNIYHHAVSEPPQPFVYNGGYQPPYPATRPPPSPAAPEPNHPDHPAPRWAPSQGYAAHQNGFFPSGGAGFGGPSFPPPYGFDPSVPPPPFGCPPSGPGPFPTGAPPAPIITYSSTPQPPGPFPQTARCDLDTTHKHHYESFCESGALLFPPQGRDHNQGPGAPAPPEDEAAVQRRLDQQWLGRFLQGMDAPLKSHQRQKQGPLSSDPDPRQAADLRQAPDLRQALTRAAQLVSQLAQSCETLRDNVENESVWLDSYLMASDAKRELQDKLKVLSDPECLDRWKGKTSRVAERRARRHRARKELLVEERQREERSANKEAAIDKWRMQQIHQVEEKKRERELKLAADSVLCEVRKKQADVKRMQDVLRSLEKLRRLRKEAALRKGIVTEPECDEAFSSRLEQLRNVMKKRTTVYSAEEKALMVMLEGEQEEERRREQEKRVRKERERHLQRKYRVDAMLFGDELPTNSVLQPFREYYTQAEHSLHALLQIRREWDAFLVPADHSDGSPVPQSWILPDAPSDQAWASALHNADTE
ncbi:programmed cell death protein 7 [Centropristis striata]|uniref:programmed cell death protein 7 n=1 Tax=Centropristis striata TaxID=184440 RepID=UPI0027E19857|nr:programmed cell death protein 7 [Centropristis striata]